MNIAAMIRERRETNDYRTSERERIERRIENARKRLDKLKPITHLDFLEDLAAALRVRMPDRRIETLGPFGLGCETAIHVHDEDGKTVASLSFQPDDANAPGLLVIDAESRSPYPEGSIGRMNGLGRRTVPLPATIDELVDQLRRQEAARRAETATA